MFFPKLKRQSVEKYHNANGRFYADYRRNYSKLEVDCCRRCVYCDVLLDEVGGEGMHVDHFRPKVHFEHLESDPFNLVLACPRCNGLKSDDWPAGKSTSDTYIENVGYIDYFNHDVSKYLRVDNLGYICELQPPVSYIVTRLDLNRKSRVLVRYKRLLNDKKNKISKEITSLLEDLEMLMNKQAITMEEASVKVRDIIALKKMLDNF
ncbi:hypothetical protein J2X32_004051 [Rheinheimera pacifica]|uniref:HNH endonuclease n=1 Tax=Rheinheimera pacifica TaxID=173990 RepID=UPI002858B7BB|nr:HNH endonuclease [Rheinheimera pacifica]MDR6985386.1 hypothetical protein [Rheinheimera pacifica]